MDLLNFFAPPAYANCPICIVTVGGGLLIAKKLGIDDLLVSIWLSSLNTAIAFWMVTKIKRKILNNPYLWSIFFYLTSIIYLYFSKQMGSVRNNFLGINKVIFGLTVGLVVAVGAILTDKWLRNKNKNKGKVFFPYQKVVVPLVFLITSTLIFLLLLKK